jgi:type I restriction enzyme M protein
LLGKYNMIIQRAQIEKPSTVGLQQRISKIYDHLYANAHTRTPAGISKEVGKILHTAMFIEETGNQSPAFNFNKVDLKDLNGGHSLLAVSEAKKLRKQFLQMNQKWQLYKDESKIELEDGDIAYVCGQLNGIPVSDKDRDVFGDALEIFRSQWAKREGGQFFTDQRVTSLAMTLLQFDPRKGDDLIDICTGTGGFLLAGLNHIRRELEKDPKISSVEIELVKLASKSLKGQEVDSEVCNIANATLGARLSAVTKPLVLNGDSLRPDVFNGTNDLKLGLHLCAASNPPFGTKITIKDERILKQFDLAKATWGVNAGLISPSNNLYHRPPDILFLEQNIRMLKPGEGRLAIVLPYQILSGPQMFYVRQWLLCHAELLAVIDLPGETFQPHTGTKTCLLVIKRRIKPLKEPVADNGPIFMSMPRWIGHDRRGNPVYKRTIDGKTSDEILTDFEEVEKAFEAFKSKKKFSSIHENSFAVPTSKIMADPMLRINALFNKPVIEGKSTLNTKQSAHNKDWEKLKINTVVKRIFYPTRFKRNYIDYYPGAIPFLGGSNITELIVAAEKWLSPDDPKLKDLMVKTGWILVTRSGSTGIISSVPSAWDGVAMSEHVIRIIPDPDKLDPDYLQAFLRTKYCQRLLAKGVFGSVIDEITPEFIGEIEIPIPKSKKILNSIVERMKEGENARQVALERIYGAVDMLNVALT